MSERSRPGRATIPAGDKSNRYMIMLFSLFCCLTVGSSRASAIEIGWAKVDITPSFSAPLAGFGARREAKAQGVHDPIYVRAVVFEGSGERIALVSADLLLINRALREEVNRRLRSLQLSSLLLCATHTHSGIGGYWNNIFAEYLGMGKYQQTIFDFLVDRIVTVVTTAYKNKIAARIGTANTRVEGFNQNRRSPHGSVDPGLSIMRIDDGLGNPRVAIVNFAAHATLLGSKNLLISADYPGVVSAALERQLSLAVFVAGAGGDLSPRRFPGKGSYERAAAYGLALAKATMPTLAGAHTISAVSLKSQTLEVALPSATLTGALGTSLAFLADPFFRYLTPTTTLLQTVRFNDDILTAWPGEVVSKIGLDLKTQSRRKLNYNNLWVVSQANDHIGYVQNEKGFYEGGYETSMSFFGPTLGEKLTKDMLLLLEKTRSR